MKDGMYYILFFPFWALVILAYHLAFNTPLSDSVIGGTIYWFCASFIVDFVTDFYHYLVSKNPK